MGPMKQTFRKALSAILCIQMVSTGFHGSARAEKQTNNSSSVTSPAEFLKQVQIEGDSIFGKNGCAKLDEKGNISYVSQTTQSAIQDNEETPSSIDCQERILAYTARYKQAEALIDAYEEKQKGDNQDISNENCENCNKSGGSTLAQQDPEHQCSTEEKAAISKQRDTNSNCSINCELKGSLKRTINEASFGVLGGLVKSTSSCNTDQAGTSAFGCMADFIVSLFSSLGSMCAAIWEGAKSAANAAKEWVVGLFSSHSKSEEAASNTNPAFANMTDAEIKEAQKNPQKANQSLLQKIGSGLNFILENVVGLDTPVYSELWQCAKCGERLGAICKIAGVVGKDVIKNAILIWIGGKAIQGVATLGKGLLKSAVAASSKATGIGNSFVKLVGKTSGGRTTLKWGTNSIAKISTKSVSGFKTFMATRIGKFSTLAAKKSSKALIKTLSMGAKAAGTVFEAIDNVMMMPVRISVRTGKSVANQVNLAMNQSKIFARTPILAAEDATRTGLKAIKDLPHNTELQLEVPSPTTPSMEKSKSFISSKLKGKKTKGFTNDIENATEHTAEISGRESIVVETSEGPRFIKVKNPDNVSTVRIFGEDNSKAIIQTADGKILLSDQGLIVKEFTNPKDISKLGPLLGKETKNADLMALNELKATAEVNGVKVKEPIASTEIKATENFKVEAPKECGNIPITFSAAAR